MRGVMRRADRPVVVTSAERSQEEQLRTRQTRYIAMMSIRVAALIIAAVLITVQPPLLWLWLALCAIGMIIIPWVAVIMANDRLPKDRHRLRRPDRSGSSASGMPASAGPKQVPSGRDPDAHEDPPR